MLTPLRILVAEDDLGDALLLRRAFEKAGVKAPVHFARDGQEVVDYLAGNAPFDNPINHPLPTLLLLDLKLPRLDGFEVLRWLRVQPGLRCMIVVVFTASELPDDINRAYSFGANSYVVKPHDPEALVQMVQQLQDYWQSINSMPEQENGAPVFADPASSPS